MPAHVLEALSASHKKFCECSAPRVNAAHRADRRQGNPESSNALTPESIANRGVARAERRQGATADQFGHAVSVRRPPGFPSSLIFKKNLDFILPLLVVSRRPTVSRCALVAPSGCQCCSSLSELQ